MILYQSHPLPSSQQIRDGLILTTFGDITQRFSRACDKCAVCLVHLRDHDVVRELRNCCHVFHKECIDRWVDHDHDNHKTCPLCRAPLLTTSQCSAWVKSEPSWAVERILYLFGDDLIEMAAGGFVNRAFESMLKECSGKKYPDLQKAIQTYIDSTKVSNQQSKPGEMNQAAPLAGAQGSLESEDGTAKTGTQSDNLKNTSEEALDGKPVGNSGNITVALANAGCTLDEAEVEIVLNPFRLAFETKNLKIIEPALDCLHKLIAYDHLEGDPGLEGGKNVLLFTDILSMVCSCVDNSSPDSTILQVLKVLLTAVASAKFRVHGEPLLGVIRICYNIALHSKSPINQATARAMLTQMISIVFRRMETDPVSTSPSSVGNVEATSEEKSNAKDEETPSVDQNEEGMTLGDALDQMKETSLASVEELQNLAGGADIKGLEAVLDKAVQIEDGKKITRYIMTIYFGEAKAVFKEGQAGGGFRRREIREVEGEEFGLMGSFGVMVVILHWSFGLLGTDDVGVMALVGIDLESMSIGQRDALLLFRTLCKMGMKEDTDEVTTKTRILSLELLQGLLEGVSHSFTKNFHFIDSVKAYLSYALLRASVSHSPVIFQYAAGIFSVLILRFRESLKFAGCLRKFCKDPQMLVDVYVNYDCDLEAPNLFERMVTTLSKIAQGTQSADPNAVASQATSIKGSSLQCLVNVLKSLVDWEKLCRQFEKKIKRVQSLEGELSARESVEIKIREDVPIPNNFEKAKAHKSTMEAAIGEFNRKPVKGVEYLISNKLVENNPTSVAQFLRNTPNLDKAMIGDYLGQHEEFPLAVMHAYVDSMKFSGMKFDKAIREFLKGFRLPGEAQKIDRIMEKFAERYGVIMLNTDAHNPMVWPKMAKSDFIRMNAMNDAEDCAPTDLLEEIYDSIVKEEIKMKDDAADIGKSRQKPESEERGRLVNILNLALPKRKSSIDAKSESEAIIKQTQAIFRKQGTRRGIFHMVQQIEIVRPMVEAVGWPLLATFSVTMEEEALRTLLSLCDSETDSLQDTWNAVLECVSRLEFITSTPAIAATVMHGSNQISRDAILQSLRELAGKPAEQVFVNSVKLPSDSVVEFFTALCGVSAEELRQTPARVFSLQKLVEISYYNMARIRMVWARIWSVLANHFISAGSHHEEKIAMYAIDSLRQLGMKYLERAELTNFTFQNDILKPFVVLMRNSRSDSIRRLIVDCIVQMIKSKVGSIKSGWHSVFMIFTAAADDELESIVESAFENVEQVILEHFDQVVGDCFMDCVNCLIRFANNKTSHRISLKAIALLRICEDRLAEGLIPGGALKPIDDIVDVNFDVAEHYWFPMLAGLSDLTSDARPEVRSCALEVLFDLLNERGSKFSSSFWESIFHRVLFPIFDHVRHAGKESLISSDDEWFRETSIHSLQLLCNLFNAFYKEVCFMLPPLLSLLLDCAKKTDQTVVSISLGALVHLIEVGGHQFSESDWNTLLKSIRDASYTTQPLELLNALSFENLNSPSVLVTNSEVITSDVADNHLFDISDNGKVSALASPSRAHVIGGNHNAFVLPDSISNLDGSEGLPSPSGRAQQPAEAAGFQRSQTLGQKIMGNMMDNLFMRSLTSKSKARASDASVPSSPIKVPDPVEPDAKDEEESPLMTSIRGKCITQLLLLGAIDSIQVWMPIFVFVLPLNLLRQELAGTSIYLDVLQKTTSGFCANKGQLMESNVSEDVDITPAQNNSNVTEDGTGDEKLEGIAEAKLVSFCEQVLKEASDLQSSVGETTNMDVHRVLELRSPIIVKVLKSMCFMNDKIFRRHLRDFYPLLTKLVCCDQMEIRGALGDLFRVQLKALLP
ncbi:hypothetical protein GH714_028804 [Hevea brasiliensis]|uniref:RING-type domain-containing protein n=1 Tax=Hevea brasiliensis TaxID=3981 RepID=A0A6A6LS10_HEVBR|nr:hypothetical protein GH714_028804 [Hevea brasiliensis]